MINLHPTYRRVFQWALMFEAVWWTVIATSWFTNSFEQIGLRFLYPNIFGVWIIIPMLFLITFWQWQWKSRLFAAYEGKGKTRMLWVSLSPLRAFLHYILLRSFVFFIVLAMAQPVGGSKKVNGSKRVLDLVICLDVSNSMNTVDISGKKVSRLTAAKNAIQELLNQLKGERIAVIIFANDAYVQLPLTMDYGAAKLFVPDIETSMITDQGTNIGAALELAQTQFKDTESGKAIVIITDGEDHERLYSQQIQTLREKRVELAFLGLGSTKGGLIPNDPYDPAQGYKRENGSAVVSRLNQAALKQMATDAGSILVLSDTEFPNVYDIATNFKNSANKQVKKIEFNVEKNYYFVPSLLAIGSLLIYLFLPYVARENT
jgi:Ca-activated chloride channel family protein